jgi:phospholipid/cholesterol/gamma-HCH transport system substrate-binding protein
MNQSRLELKVGLFVLFCLAVFAALLIQFSKGTILFRPTYIITLDASNIGGLRPRASVLLSGVQVGTVSEIKLSNEGTNVAIYLKIYSQYVIRDDARFVIEQSGFLGDQFVAIYPDLNKGTPFASRPDAIAHAQEPFNLQEVARSAAGFIKHLDETAAKLDAAINDVRRDVLNERTLTNLAFTVDTLERVSVNAGTVVDNINSLIISNGGPAGIAVSNLLTFSERLNTFAQSAQSILDTNQPQINLAISNLQVSTAQLTNLLAEVRSSKGLAGTLINDPALAHNVSDLVSNLDASAGYLRSNGLWHFLWKPKLPDTNTPATASGRNSKK